MTMEGGPELTLRGENLTYYRNIQYLKELTKQATALLSRSNALYTNILNDQEVAVKVRGLSDSTDCRSSTPDFSCATCGLYHGAPFCIVDKIDKEEKFWAERHKAKLSTIGPQWKETRKESIRESDDVEVWRKPFKLGKIYEEKEKTPVKIDEPWSVPIDNRSPEEILTTYEALSARFGRSSGRRYLLATSLAVETQPWTPSCVEKIDEENLNQLKMKFREQEIDCFPVRPHVSGRLCPQYSEEVRKKLEVVVEVLPNCQTIGNDKPKRWRDILCRPRRASGSKVQVFDHPDEEIEERQITERVVCKCGMLDCDCGGKQGCSIRPRPKTCELLFDGGNNYLSTVRSKLERRRLARQHRRKSSVRSSATSNTRQRTVSSKRKSSDQFAHLAYAETFAMLDNCIGNELPSNELESLVLYRKKIEELARLASPSSMIPEREWNVWYDNYREARRNVDENSDTMDSDIQSTESDLSEHSKKSSDLDYKERAMLPSRIPYATETYNLINRFFDKITLKLEKSIKKHSTKSDFNIYRPTFAYAAHKLNMLKSENEVFRKTGNNMKQPHFYSKTFTPFTVRRRTKMNRINVVSTKIKNAWNRRMFIEGIQQGKRLKYRKNTKKYTKEGGYLGFTPKKRELLQMIESRRFTSCDLVGDVTGRKITKKTMYDDYQLLSNLFDEPTPHLRMSLLDEGMKQRMERYKKINLRYGEPTLPEPPECSSVHDFGISGDLSKIQKKLEKEDIRFVRSLQKNTSSGGMRSEEHEKHFGSILANSPLSSREMSKFGRSNKNKSYYSLDQTARVSTLHRGTKPVSQNILLGSDNDGQTRDPTDPNRHGPLAEVYGSNLKTASLQKSVDARSSKLTAPSKNEDAASSSVADTRFPPAPPPSVQKRKSLSPSKLQTLSSSQRASRNTPTESRFPSSHGLNDADKGSTSKLPTSGKITPMASTQVGSKTQISSHSGKMDSGIGLSAITVSSIMGDSTVLAKDRVRSRSLIVEPGSKLIPQKGMKSSTISGIISEIPEADEPVSSRILGQPGESKELKKRTSKRVQDKEMLSDLSVTKMRGMKAVDRLGPTKKRVFGVDIGQGINYVQYLRDNAAGADEDKKQELLNLLTAPREKKRVAPGKPVSSKTALLTESQQGSLNRDPESSSETVLTRKKKMSLDSGITDSITRLQRNPIKTLDQIYKEVHGINRRNTPADLIDNDYEHAMMKKQQLRKHKIL